MSPLLRGKVERFVNVELVDATPTFQCSLRADIGHDPAVRSIRFLDGLLASP